MFKIWGYDSETELNIVWVYISYLRKKLSALEANVRIVGATNSDLKKMCQEGKFKEDLLDRLSFEVLFVPPLRKRGADVLLLARYFASKMAMECGFGTMPIISEEVEKALMGYSWPGNVRELKNVIERSVYRSENGEIASLDFNPFKNPYSEDEKESPQAQDSIKEKKFFEYDLVDLDRAHSDLDVSFLSRALDASGGNQKLAAEKMGITYDQFRGLYRKHKDRLK